MAYVAAIIAAFCFWYSGYIAAHKEVGRECERLGSFYVGDKTYDCKLRQGADQ